MTANDTAPERVRDLRAARRSRPQPPPGVTLAMPAHHPPPPGDDHGPDRSCQSGNRSIDLFGETDS